MYVVYKNNRMCSTLKDANTNLFPKPSGRSGGRGGERVHLDFFPSFFFIVEGEGGRGVEVNVFFFSLHWKCGRRRGERG
jgi:hypothetical protein